MNNRLKILTSAILFLFSTTSALAEGNLHVNIETTKGAIKLELYADKTPVTVANFANLVERGYYDGLKFHRVYKRLYGSRWRSLWKWHRRSWL